MGNISSNNSKNTSENTSEKKFDNFYDIIDYIATYYIFVNITYSCIMCR